MKPSTLLWPLAGLLGWSGAFVLVYSLHGIGCARGWQDVPVATTNLQYVLQVGSFLACVLALAGLAAWLHWRAAPAFSRGGNAMLASVTRITGWVGLTATAFTLFPVLVTSVCR